MPQVMPACGSMRQINLLRTVEALRMYAAEHGRWPEKLDEIKAVPVPNDPFTEKPFEYAVKDGVALLRPTPDARAENTPRHRDRSGMN